MNRFDNLELEDLSDYFELRPEQNTLDPISGWVMLDKLEVISKVTQAATSNQIIWALVNTIKRVNKANLEKERVADDDPTTPTPSNMVMGQIELVKQEFYGYLIIGTLSRAYPSGNMVMLINGNSLIKQGHVYGKNQHDQPALILAHCTWTYPDCMPVCMPYDISFYCQARQTMAKWLLEELHKIQATATKNEERRRKIVLGLGNTKFPIPSPNYWFGRIGFAVRQAFAVHRRTGMRNW